MYIIIPQICHSGQRKSALALIPCHITAKMARLKFGKIVIIVGHKRMSKKRRRRKRRKKGGEGVSNNY